MICATTKPRRLTITNDYIFNVGSLNLTSKCVVHVYVLFIKKDDNLKEINYHNWQMVKGSNDIYILVIYYGNCSVKYSDKSIETTVLV